MYLTKIIADNVPFFSFILSVIVAWLLIPLETGFPMVAFVIFFMGLSTLVYGIRKNRHWFDTILYLGILSLSCFLLIRANEATQFITFMFVFFFGSLLILPLSREHSLLTLILTPFTAVLESFTGKSQFNYSLSIFEKLQETKNLKPLLPTFGITFLFLGVTIPLLASANPIFKDLLESVLNLFNLSSLLNYFNEEQIFINILRFVLLIFLSYAIPRALTASIQGAEIQEDNFSLPINFLIPKIAMGLLLIIFFITQAQLYFATPEILQSLGYTNARLTNEVFFQVTLVAFIIFFLAYLDKERKTLNNRLTYFLIIEAFFLVGMAFKSVFDYTIVWGFSEKRLWGYATMTWLSGALILFLYYYIKQIPLYRFFQYIVTYTIVVLLGINVANFDYLISHFSQSQKDYQYLSTLSPDSQVYNETLEIIVIDIEKSDEKDYEKIEAAYKLIRKIDVLQQKYGNDIPINSFNFSEYREYMRVKDIDTETYYERVSLAEIYSH